MRDPDAAAKLLTDAAIAAAPTAEARKGLQILRHMADPEPQPVDLTTNPARSLYLSDAAWTKASVGWGKVARNRYCFNRGQWEGMLLMIDGKVYGKGLYAHADSSYVFPLNGGWQTFTATVGLRDGADSQGSAVFTVLGDGRKLHRTPVLRPGGSKEIRLDVAGVKSLELRATGGEGHNRNAWSIWADPKVTR
jgi:endo-alpha-N-acetylgalactosaminidase